MSLGNSYNDQNNRQNMGITTYSPYAMSNPESEIDATRLAFRYWKNTIVVSIFPRKNTGNDEIAFDKDNGISIYLSHSKARVLANEIRHFLQDPVHYSSVGVNSGSAVITISNGTEYGKDAPVATIRKIDDEGKVVASFAYEFKRNFYFSIRNYTGEDFDKSFDDYQNLELEQFIDILDEYVKASTYAIAHTVMDQRSYSVNRIEDKINSIAAALGVETARNSGARKSYSNNTYFNNASGGNNKGYSSGVSYESATIDDLE